MIVGCAMSPDGTQVVYSNLGWKDETDRRDTDLWVRSRGWRRSAAPHLRAGLRQCAALERRRRVDLLHVRALASAARTARLTTARHNSGGFARTASISCRSRDSRRESTATSLSKDGKTLHYLVHRDQEDDPWKDLRSKHKDIVDCGSRYAQGLRNLETRPAHLAQRESSLTRSAISMASRSRLTAGESPCTPRRTTNSSATKAGRVSTSTTPRRRP